MLGGLGRLALAHSDGDDSDNHYEESANTSFTPANTGLSARIVVVGGGMAGATAAKYLRLWGGTGLQVTLVEPAARYTSNIMSNLCSTAAATSPPSTTATTAVRQVRRGGEGRTGRRHRHRRPHGGPVRRQQPALRPAGRGAGGRVCRRLRPHPGRLRHPHPRWQAGPQTSLLASQLATMQNGIRDDHPPRRLIRCRGQRSGPAWSPITSRPIAAGSRVIVHENATIQAERETFTHAFGATDAGVVRYEAA